MLAPHRDGNSKIAAPAFSDLPARRRPYLTPALAAVDNPRVIAQSTFWSSLLNLGDRVGADAWTLALMATMAATISAVYVIQLRRKFQITARRLAAIEALVENRAREEKAPPLNVFCQQLMNALGMELPGAISERMSPDDPARFIRALTIYTRAQRRRLVALYRQAESLREALHPDGGEPGDTCPIGKDRLGSLASPEVEPSIPRPSQRIRDRALDLQLVR